MKEPELSDHLSKRASAYYKCVVDPRSNKACRSICSYGGQSGHTGLDKLKAVATVTVGANKYGYVSFDPYGAGPTNDVAIAHVSTAATTLGGGDSPQSLKDANATAIYWADAQYSGTAYANQQSGLQQRCVAAAIYIRPVGGAVTQNGIIHCLEVPLHPAWNGTGGSMSFNKAISNNRTREIRGVQTSGTSLNVLNMHPQAVSNIGVLSSASGAPLGEGWLGVSPATTTLTYNAGMIVLTGDSGTSYELEIHGIYETKGYAVTDLKPSFSDQIGYERIMNALLRKSISGWVGHPSDALASYSAALHHSEISLNEDSRVNVTKSKSWWDHAKDAAKKYAPLAKEIGGFALGLL